jgi:Uma2 family endonuclease
MLRIGPRDHGREMTYEEFMDGDYEEGYKYELIEGRLYVVSGADPPHDRSEQHIFGQLLAYWHSHPDILAWVSNKARVFVPGKRRSTAPEPDIAAYRTIVPDFEDWREVSPLIVCEILNRKNKSKDCVRNVTLYQLVPSILEYWIYDTLRPKSGPRLLVFSRRRGSGKWQPAEFGPHDSYTTPLLPGFVLPVKLVNKR